MSPSTLFPQRSTGRRRHAQRRALLGFGVVAVLLHLALLGAAGERGIGAGPAAGPVRPLAVRTIEIAPAATEVSLAAPATEVESASPAAPSLRTAAAPADPAFDVAKAPPQRHADSEKASTRLQLPRDGSGPLPQAPPPAPRVDPSPAVAEARTPGVEPAPVAAVEFDPPETTAESGMMKVALAAPRATPASFLAAGEKAPPLYRTVLPGPVTLRYELRRGLFRGTGEIRWRPAGARYALQFDARLAGISLLSQSSQGELDAHGLAPVRFVDQRARKAARAVNFSRDTGTISFSGSTTQWPLLAGSQDRLSWMIQLGGIVAADPALATSGRISMVLVSARGEAAVRSVRFAGRENAETVSGSVPALKFVVDGHSAYDGSFEIWLDPARGYLPAHATSRNSAGDAEFELLLQRTEP